MGQEGEGLYRPLASSAVIVPTSVEVEGKGLRWRVVYPITYKPTGKRLLEDFVKLDAAPVNAIRDYARKWGVLEICKHGYPRSHNSATWPRSWVHLFTLWDRYAPQTPCEPFDFKCGKTEEKETRTRDSSPLNIMRSDGRKGAVLTTRHTNSGSGSTESKSSTSTVRALAVQHYEEGWEPVERWRYFARQARAILNIAARPNPTNLGLSEEWKILYQEYSEEFERLPTKMGAQNIEHTRRLLSFAVNDWFQLGAVRPQFVWKERVARLEVGGPTLFGHLAVQLALAVSRTEAMVFCSHCGIPYLPSRQPNRNQRHFCDRCRDEKHPRRLASLDYRARLNRSRNTRVQNPTLKRP